MIKENTKGSIAVTLLIACAIAITLIMSYLFISSHNTDTSKDTLFTVLKVTLLISNLILVSGAIYGYLIDNYKIFIGSTALSAVIIAIIGVISVLNFDEEIYINMLVAVGTLAFATNLSNLIYIKKVR